LIVLDLECEQGHSFEGRFASADSFERQLSRHLISCPACGLTRALRRPSAPYVQTRSAATPGPAKSARPEPSALVSRVLAHLRLTAQNMEDVGERFPEEARRIHYGDAASRSIKGLASSQELRDLLEEGIGVLPIPPDEDLH
jgi:hypothetical protein